MEKMTANILVPQHGPHDDMSVLQQSDYASSSGDTSQQHDFLQSGIGIIIIINLLIIDQALF